MWPNVRCITPRTWWSIVTTSKGSSTSNPLLTTGKPLLILISVLVSSFCAFCLEERPRAFWMTPDLKLNHKCGNRICGHITPKKEIRVFTLYVKIPTWLEMFTWVHHRVRNLNHLMNCSVSNRTLQNKTAYRQRSLKGRPGMLRSYRSALVHWNITSRIQITQVPDASTKFESCTPW